MTFADFSTVKIQKMNNHNSNITLDNNSNHGNHNLKTDELKKAALSSPTSSNHTSSDEKSSSVGTISPNVAVSSTSPKKSLNKNSGSTTHSVNSNMISASGSINELTVNLANSGTTNSLTIPYEEYISTVSLPFDEFRTATPSKLNPNETPESANLDLIKDVNEFIDCFPYSKVIPYARYIVKIMTFINKFESFFPLELLDLSYQDFEIGLSLIDEKLLEKNEESALKLIRDKMDLLCLSLLKLLFAKENNEVFKPRGSIMNYRKTKSPYGKLLQQLRKSLDIYGYPIEWKTQEYDSENNSQNTLHDKMNEEPVDPNHPEILIPDNPYSTNFLLLPLEEDPLQNRRIEKVGLIALEPLDRVIFLSTLCTWCLSYSVPIRTEINYLTNIFKGYVSVDTQYVPRYLKKGSFETKHDFLNLCKKVEIRIEKRKRRRGLNPASQSQRTKDLKAQLDILDSIKKSLKFVKTTTEKNEINLIKNYKKWCQIFDIESSLIVESNPISNPYKELQYKLRLNEFFVNRIPKIGDFYIPRLHTYSLLKSKSTNNEEFSVYTDLINLETLLDEFKNGNYTARDIYYSIKNSNLTISLRFKLLFHNTSGAINGINFTEKRFKACDNYWYEICYDSKSLLTFIKYLENSLLPQYEASLNDRFIKDCTRNVSISEVSTNSKETNLLEGDTDIIDNGLGEIKSLCDPQYDSLVVLYKYLDKMRYYFQVLEQVQQQGEEIENEIKIKQKEKEKEENEIKANQPLGVRRSSRLRKLSNHNKALEDTQNLSTNDEYAGGEDELYSDYSEYEAELETASVGTGLDDEEEDIHPKKANQKHVRIQDTREERMLKRRRK
ncbi:hypothetical protein TBLA_0C01170 [Henningerozyma blattae CBS 6284]|uniref:WHIM1 domain-containing protein n=1 Tax=Henningerozyma blattae (strain ATCC 34711 / CBS 6284 / DSM 70876 / NBRC 10599 / NRRL Y-10934 / UCD 77-7) TaxID=1071380 RepID=I2H0N0_HENB6|nr:hypothetical protein TBLA_0C01170 [Tetrapisispora blattae CBS 6284]CCH59932.1 hypothetical protein TBLA_0C01170 [Tetrapisispora blattae CBS 6284]